MSQNNYNPLAMNGFQPVNNAMQQPFYSGPYNSNMMNPQQYGYSYGAVQPMNRMNQPQQMRPSGVNGRMVNSDSEITPQEIPMDGSVSLFPAADYSCIYAKSWTANGTIQTVKFIPAVEIPASTPVQEDPYAPVMKRLDDIEDMLNRMLSNKSSNGAAKNAKRDQEVEKDV